MTITQTRREREKVEMRQLIVDAAIKIYIRDGYEKLSLRGIAQEIEYAAGTIYLYFKDKHELFHAMHEWAFAQLIDEFEKELKNIENPVEILRGISRVYLTFAFKNPELYDLMFILHEPMCAEANVEIWACGLQAFSLLLKTIESGVHQRMLKPENPQHLAFMFWSSAHGMISLHLRNRLRMYDGQDLQKMIAQVEEMVLIQFLTAKGVKALSVQP